MSENQQFVSRRLLERVAFALLTVAALFVTLAAVIQAAQGSASDRRPLDATSIDTGERPAVGVRTVVSQTVEKLNLTLSATSVTAGEPVTLTTEALDAAGEPITSGISISFTTTLGQVAPPTATTDANGLVTATLVSTRTGTAVVAARHLTVGDSASVLFLPGPTEQITVTAQPPAIPVDGATSQILAALLDRYGNRVGDDIPVTFTTSLGTVTPMTATAVAGRATTVLRSGPIHGTASVTATVGTYTGSTDVAFLPADLRINSTNNPAGEILPGSPVTYTITYENTGGAAARNVVITNTLADGLINTSFQASGPTITARKGATYVWDVEDLSPEEGGTITLHGQFDPDRDWGLSQFVANTAEIRSMTAEGDSSDNSTTTGNIIVTSDMFVQASIDNDYSVLQPGGRIRYTVSVGNSGQVPAQGFVITDTLPAYTSFKEWREIWPLAPGLVYASEPSDAQQVWHYNEPVTSTNFAQFYILLDIAPDAPGGVVLRNEIELRTPTPEGQHNNNMKSISHQLSGVNLQVGLSGPATITPDRRITYTLAYSNTGTVPATEVTLVNTLPAGVAPVSFTREPDTVEDNRIEWAIGNLPAGLRRQITVVGEVNQDVKPDQILETILSATTTTPESFTGDNTATANVRVVPGAPYTLTLDMEPTEMAVGTTIPIRVSVTDRFDNPIDGLTTVLTTTAGVVTPTVVTTTQGHAEATYTAPRSPAEGVITAMYADLLTDTIDVLVRPGPPSSIQLQADVESMPADGESTTVISTWVGDSYGNPVEDGTMVTFETDRGRLYNGKSEHTVGTFDGMASTVLTAGRTPGLARVTAAVGSLEREIQIELTPLPLTFVRLPLIARNDSGAP